MSLYELAKGPIDHRGAAEPVTATELRNCLGKLCGELEQALPAPAFDPASLSDEQVAALLRRVEQFMNEKRAKEWADRYAPPEPVKEDWSTIGDAPPVPADDPPAVADPPAESPQGQPVDAPAAEPAPSDPAKDGAAPTIDVPGDVEPPTPPAIDPAIMDGRQALAQLLDADYAAKLQAADLWTVADVKRYLAAHGDLTPIAGIGKVADRNIREALAAQLAE